MRAASLTSRPPKQAGYTLLLVMFIVATMLIAAAAVTPNLLTQGRRDKEEEMVWRGEQYARAIRLYYTKFGKYPTKIEDLTRQSNGVRFLRKAYTDPMNKDDGSWRLIYMGPNGQLIGSLRPSNLLQNSLATPGLAVMSALGGGMQAPAPPPAGANPQPGQPGAGAAGQPANPATAANPLESQPQPFEGAVLGGSIAGVGSKIKRSSFRLYQGGETYQQWEFVWNSAGQMALPAQTPANPNANPTTAPNANNPNSPDGQQPQQTPQTPVVNVPPPQAPAQ